MRTKIDGWKDREEKEIDFNVGDVVRLKSGGQKMTIAKRLARMLISAY